LTNLLLNYSVDLPSPPKTIIANMGNELTTINEDLIIRNVAKGVTEFQVAELMGIPMEELVKYLANNPDFYHRLETARKIRAEKWMTNIVGLVTDANGKPIIHDSEEVPGVKLAIDTYKWLAKVDNQDKFSEKTKVETTSTNVLEIKGLSAREAMEILKADPFAPAVPAEYVVVENKPSEEKPIHDDEDML
jgi:hypothetical protein